ncbi:DUF6292 family protein [Bailinhaonella thermotolerans]|uniref:DUF6292 domain-containing protein n=1 Tax=Bailinhaonella thermotolerans TaxID=1070861 RepID=A0A3A4A7Y6_9ACTN|nr:DUF6292 family protein [Bailinhaonella thermotolerans]RJL21106.1 hypothetical protein D5H75_38495 [Bailinhaonella thermotolerans]
MPEHHMPTPVGQILLRTADLLTGQDPPAASNALRDAAYEVAPADVNDIAWASEALQALDADLTSCGDRTCCWDITSRLRHYQERFGNARLAEVLRSRAAADGPAEPIQPPWDQRTAHEGYIARCAQAVGAAGVAVRLSSHLGTWPRSGVLVCGDPIEVTVRLCWTEERGWVYAPHGGTIWDAVEDGLPLGDTVLPPPDQVAADALRLLTRPRLRSADPADTDFDSALTAES